MMSEPPLLLQEARAFELAASPLWFPPSLSGELHYSGRSSVSAVYIIPIPVSPQSKHLCVCLLPHWIGAP